MKKNNKKNKTIFIIVILILFIMLSLLILFFTNNKKVTSKDSLQVSDEIELKGLSDFKSIKEILEFSGAKYISEENIKNSDYDIKISTEFKYDLYEDNVSQEKYFLAIINRISYLLRYNKNYILVDNSKNIEIKVVCKDNKTAEILINGEVDYFLKHDNQNSLNAQKEDKMIDVRVQADELETLIDNNWNYSEDIFGSEDSKFDNYYIFHDEGISVRVIQNKIYNIVFNKTYENNVISGISVGESFDDIINVLGNPIYIAQNESYIGYKTKEFYVFFSKSNLNGDEISIYPNETFEVEEFEKLTNRFISNEIEIKEFMNELTYLWPDYDSYKYSSNYLKITYPNKGVGIEYGNDTKNGIILYKNYNLTDESKKWLENVKVFCELEEDLVVKKELQRLDRQLDIKMSAAYMFEFSDKTYVESDIYSYSFDRTLNGDINKILFISKDKENINKELKETITNGFFIDNESFVYGIANEGIFVFNVLTNEKQVLIEGEEPFELIEYKENILYYDDGNVILEME